MVVAEIEAPAVIGVDFLWSHQCTLDMRAGVLSIEGTTHICRHMETMPQVFRITAAETMIIPPMSEMIIPGKMSDHPPVTQGIVEANVHQLCEGNVVVARAVVNPAGDILPVRVMNMSPEPQKLFQDK